MAFVQAKCTNCGGVLAVDNSQDAAVCPFCNTPYVVEKAINNYNITNNIQANVVNVYGNDGSLEIEHLLKNAETFLKLKKYKDAEEKYKEASDKYPDDYRGWFGYALSHLNRMISSKDYGLFNIEELENSYNICMQLCDDKEKTKRDFCEQTDTEALKSFMTKNFCFDHSIMIDENIRNSFVEEHINYIKSVQSLLQKYNNTYIYDVGCYYYGEIYHNYSGKDELNGQIVWDNKNKGYKSDRILKNMKEHLIIQGSLDAVIQKIQADFKHNFHCQHCGGNFKGILKKVCTNCGKEKDY